MTRPALRKPQADLFAPGPAACMAPQAAPAPAAAFVHPCEAPGCAAWGALGFGAFRGVRGRWFCEAHRQFGEAA